MNKRMVLALLLLAGCFQTQAQTGLPAFPGAEGFGKYVTGGRGGKVCHVTSLADRGPGTLREALEAQGARTVVFDVAGTIHLERPIRIRHGNLTVAGQTSPGGICVADQPISVSADNVIVRYLTMRPGDKYKGEPDGFGGSDCRDIIIDHCSVSWSVDECFTIYGVENATSQWCLVAQPLRISTHVKGGHGYGAIWGGIRSSYLNNLIAHAESRVPRLGPRVSTQTREWLDIRNNVFYNWAGGGCYGGEGQKANIVNNYYKPGPATLASSGPIQYRITSIGVRTTAYCQNARGEWNAWAPMLHVWGKFYIDGNVMAGNEEVTRDNWTRGVYEQTRNDAGVDFLWTQTTRDTVRLREPLAFGEVRTRTAEATYAAVLQYVGNSLYRDVLDETVLADVKNGTATYTAVGNKPGFINTPADAGGYPVIETDTSRPDATDTDGDGMPDLWERAQGLDATDPADGRTSTLSAEGYTNLEVYLNGLVSSITAGQNE